MAEFPEPEAPGDAAVERILARARPALESILRRFGIPVHDAPDLLQAALLDLLRSWNAVENPPVWLCGTLRNKCLQYWRSRYRRLYVAIDADILGLMADEQTEPPERRILRRELREGMQYLPRRCRSILGLRYGLECDREEIAARTGYSVKSVGRVLHRCLRLLTGLLVGNQGAPNRA